jgi:adenine-specific DNA-methyltransferase
VGSAFKGRGFEVHTGDLLMSAHCFQTARVVLNKPPTPTPALKAALNVRTTEDMINSLRRVKPVKSWVYREFSARRRYFTSENAAAIDGTRRALERWRRDGLTDEPTDLYLRACLIDAVDRVANTAGTYYAHLKQWTRKALKPFDLRAIEPVSGPVGCTASLIDATELVASRHFDVLYLDPPYNTRDYAGYYHLPETLATGRRPRPQGASGVDAAARPVSAFTRPRQAESAMTELVGIARCHLMVVHYSDDGLIGPARMRALLRSFGRIEERTIDALGYGTTRQRLAHHRLYFVEP